MYYNDHNTDKKSIGVCLSKLKREHLEPTSFSKMRVDLAAQVVVMLHVTER